MSIKLEKKADKASRQSPLFRMIAFIKKKMGWPHRQTSQRPYWQEKSPIQDVFARYGAYFS